MSFQFCRRKFYFLLALALPGYAAVHPVQHSAREQVNAQVLNAASQKIESLAQQRQLLRHGAAQECFLLSARAVPVQKI